MEIRELKSFHAVAKLKSVSKAAKQLRLGQPTVTMHIKKLEDELGVLLFDRVKRPLQPTSAAIKLMELVEPLLQGIDGLAAKTASAEEQGPVRIGSTYEIISHALLDVSKKFMEEHPHVKLIVRSGTRAEILQMLSDGEADVGILPGLERRRDFDFEGLFPYERVIITPVQHPLLKQQITRLDQIAEWPLILMGRGTYTRTMLEEEFKRKGLNYEIVMELDGMDMIKRYVALGMGISVGPRLSMDSEDRDKVGVINLGTLMPVDQVGAVTLHGKTLSKPVMWFLDILRSTFKHKD